MFIARLREKIRKVDECFRIYLLSRRVCVCGRACLSVRVCGYLLSSEPTGAKRRRDDTDAMRWHVPSGGFGVVVILLFSYSSPFVTPHIIQILRFKVP